MNTKMARDEAHRGQKIKAIIHSEVERNEQAIVEIIYHKVEQSQSQQTTIRDEAEININSRKSKFQKTKS
jgi:hypothetical protein